MWINPSGEIELETMVLYGKGRIMNCPVLSFYIFDTNKIFNYFLLPSVYFTVATAKTL